jgi:hypothetical protein
VIGNARQGVSVALSSDGNTAIVGGPADDGWKGAAWVFTRTYKPIPAKGPGAGAWVWTEQKKLVGTEAMGNAHQGVSVALSSDGNTAIVGGPHDDMKFGGGGFVGAAWVYTRSGGVWTQQKKLVGTGAIGVVPEQGKSVALSSDGNTAIVGGPADHGWVGAAWVFTRSFKLIPGKNPSTYAWVWTEQKKLVGTGPKTDQWQGESVSLSSDGNTAIVGGPFDDGGKGAAWVFTHSGGVWTEQKKLVGTEAIGNPSQGSSVSLSSDGNTAIVGGPADNEITSANRVGAAWVYTRSGGVWTQQKKLVGTGAIGNAQQGQSVALSSDGNTAIVGGPADDGWKGAAWVYVWQSNGKGLPVAIDPMALILEGKALDIWYEIHHPHEPKVAEIQQVLRSMTPEEQKEALNRARTLENYAKAEQKRLGSMPPEEQKAALNRARTLENYGKAVEEAFATMKK